MKNLLFTLSKKNNLIGIIFLGLPFFADAQSDLQRQFSLEASIMSLGIAYEQPILKHTEAEFSAGVTDFFRSEMGYSINTLAEKFSPYTKVAFRHYYNRNRRERKGRDNSFNKGSFIAFQNKMLYGATDAQDVRMINEIHWGVQTPLVKKLLFTFHIGIGHYYRKSYIKQESNGKYRPLAPTIGLKLKYVLF